MDPTQVATLPTEVIEETASPLLEEIAAHASLIADASVKTTGFLLFFVVVILCFFAYKFLRIFF